MGDIAIQILYIYKKNGHKPTHQTRTERGRAREMHSQGCSYGPVKFDEKMTELAGLLYYDRSALSVPKKENMKRKKNTFDGL